MISIRYAQYIIISFDRTSDFLLFQIIDIFLFTFYVVLWRPEL